MARAVLELACAVLAVPTEQDPLKVQFGACAPESPGQLCAVLLLPQQHDPGLVQHVPRSAEPPGQSCSSFGAELQQTELPRAATAVPIQRGLLVAAPGLAFASSEYGPLGALSPTTRVPPSRGSASLE